MCVPVKKVNGDSGDTLITLHVRWQHSVGQVAMDIYNRLEDAWMHSITSLRVRWVAPASGSSAEWGKLQPQLPQWTSAE